MIAQESLITTHLPQFRTTYFGCKSIWQLSSNSDFGAIKNLWGRKVLIAISMKNKAFSNKWLSSIIEDVIAIGCSPVITLVDKPYFDQIEVASIDCHRCDWDKLMRIKKDNIIRINRILEKNPNIIFEDWSLHLENPIYYLIEEEVKRAFDMRGIFYSIVKRHVSMVLGVSFIDADNNWSRFILSEIPTLIFLYYCKYPGLIDIYPGEQFDLFWNIENGNLKADLPISFSLFKASGSHIYANATLA